MTKPIYITGLTQKQRNTCVAAAVQSPEKKLTDWASRVLISAAKKELSQVGEAIDTVTFNRVEAFEAAQHLLTELSDESNTEIDLVVKWDN